jgi:adhesin/invasin
MQDVRPFMAGIVVCLLLAAAASAQSIAIVSGNGQLTCPNCTTNPSHFFEPLVVQVRDAAGNPVPNATVTWTVTTPPGSVFAAQGTVLNSTTTTDANGRSQNTFFQGTPIGVTFGSYIQSNVTATYLNSSVVFTETTTLTDTNGISQITSPTILSPLPGTSITGRTGETADVALQVAVRSITGLGVPGVEIRLVPTDANNPTTVTCAPTANAAPNTALTDATGIATCNLIFGGRPGAGSFTVKIGGNFAETNSINFTATVGLPRVIRLISGNAQSGGVGAGLPSPLVGIVEDAGGNPLPDVPVSWQVLSGSATLFNTRTISDISGRVSTNVTVGNAPGPIQIRVTASANPSATATFTATGILTVSSLTKIGAGDNQSAPVSTQFPNPLVVQVANQGVAQANIPVTFAVTSGSATLSNANPSTDAQGQASTFVTAGSTVGPVVVTATVGTLSQTFNLTVRQAGPQLSADSFMNAASFVRGANALAPCAVAQIVAPGLAPGIQGTVLPANLVGPLPLLLAGVSIQFGNLFAPIYNVSNINGREVATFQVPCDTPVGANQVVVRVGQGSATMTVPVQAVSPGLFETPMSDGRNRAVVLRPDGSFVSLENPARRGEIVRMFVTGIGPANPPVGTNQPGLPNVELAAVNPVVVGVNHTGVRVVSVTYARNLFGVFEVAFEIPADTPGSPNVPLAVAVQQGDQLIFGNGSSLPVQ